MSNHTKRRGLGSFLSGSKKSQSNTIPGPASSVSSEQSFSDVTLNSSQDGRISSSEYAQRRRELMQLVTGLLGQGAHQVMDIPRIAVIGGQSAGKSSVVEAVTGINVPRDSGTCTRCPMECTLSSCTASWSCQISLRFEYDDSGSRMSSTQHVFSPLLTDRGQVELWIRRGQAAILSPHRKLSDFAGLSRSELQQLQRDDHDMLKFSKNIVCIDIKDPHATDLSFIDLPGLIQNEDPEVVDLVKNLAVSNITNESTIILVTIPVTDEMENQLAFRLAREADPQGKRTVGVLTKPDNLRDGDVGARERWKDVIEGKSHQLKHGYYCVRLPDDAQRQRNIKPIEAEEFARTFFTSSAPWSQLGPADRRRLGVPNLVSDLSRLLMRVLEAALPKLRKDIAALLAECNENLAKLPPAPQTDNATATVILMISTFTSELRGMVYGLQESSKDLIHRNKGNYGVFRRTIRGTAPDFRPFDDRSQHLHRPLYAGDEDGDPDPLVQPFDLGEVRMVIKKHIAWEHSGYIPFEATKELLEASIKLWDVPSRTCLESAFATLGVTLEGLVKKHFSQFMRIEAVVQNVVRTELEEIWDVVANDVEHALQREHWPFWTQNDHYFECTKLKWLAIYKTTRNRPGELLPDAPYISNYAAPRSSVSIQTRQTQALQALAALGYESICAEDFHRLWPPDRYEEELRVMAGARAYFQVAYKRIIDHIPMTIEHSMNQPFADNLHAALLSALDIASSDKMEELLSEDPDVARRRAELEQTKARLVDIQRRLERFCV